jgi:hypothetical protein
VGGKPAASAQFILNRDLSVTAARVSSSEAGETWVRNMTAEFLLTKHLLHARKVLLHSVNLHGTDDFTSPPKEVVLRIFITLKNPLSSAGFEPENLGSSGKHASKIY